MKKQHQLNGIDIFSGAGGLSIGAEMAGIKIDLAIEYDKNSADTFSENHPNTTILIENIRNVKFDKKYKNPFIVFGGPPCQGFSTSNLKTRNTENSNNSLFKEFIRTVKELNPKWFLFENVEGITTFDNGAIVKQLESEFCELGYRTKFKVLTASNFGVPQNRNRFFMVGNRLSIDFEFPKVNSKKITVKDAIDDLPILNNGENNFDLPYKDNDISQYANFLRGDSISSKQNYVSRNKDYVLERYKHIKQGENWKAIPRELMANYKNSQNCHSGIYKRLDENKPSVVIANYRKNMLIHPIENRGLSVREAARLQSFPDSFIFKGSINHIQQQIGNAVPPILAKEIFNQIIKLSKK